MSFMDKVNDLKEAQAKHMQQAKAKREERAQKAKVSHEEAVARQNERLTGEDGLLTFRIHEDGRNGNVKVAPGRLIRTVEKRMMQNDTVLITYDSIQSLKIERKFGKSSIVVVTGVGTYEWKVTAAERLKEAIEAEMFGS
jgi:hypothetical protein